MSDLFDQAHDAGWEPYNLHDLRRQVSCVGSVAYMANLGGEDLDGLDRDLPDAFYDFHNSGPLTCVS